MYNFKIIEDLSYEEKIQFEEMLNKGLVKITSCNILLSSCFLEEKDIISFLSEVKGSYKESVPTEYTFNPMKMIFTAKWKLEEPITICNEVELLENFNGFFRTSSTQFSGFLDPCINTLEVEFYSKNGKQRCLNLSRMLPVAKLGKFQPVKLQGKISEIEGIKIDSVVGEQRKELLEKIVHIIELTKPEIKDTRIEYWVEHDGVIIEWLLPTESFGSPFEDIIIDYTLDELYGGYV